MKGYTIPDAILAHHTALLGKTGGGKSSTGKLMIEQVADQGFRVCILDTIKSDWWGIISSADGKKPGLPFRILGGPHGHVSLPSTAGAAIGRLVGSGKLPLSIIDMADFEAGGIQRFFVDFAEALMRSQKGVLYLVIEEAHELAPKERAGFGAENMAIHWAKKLATAGRSKGIRLVVATQRVQSLHNAVLGSCETLIAHRLTTPADQDPVLKWVKANVPDKDIQRQVSESLSSLPTGTGWLCSGEAQIFERVAFPKFRTFDNTATPTADDEEIAIKTAPVDQDELRSIIGDAVEEAESNDPKALKAKIALLERQHPLPEPEWPDQREEVEQLKRTIEGLKAQCLEAADRLTHVAQMLPPPVVRLEGPEAERIVEQLRPEIRKPRPPREDDGRLNAAARDLASLLKGLPAHECNWEALLILGGYRPNSGWIRKARKDLVDHDLVIDFNAGVRATHKLLGDETILPRRQPTPAELRSLWSEKLRGPGGTMAKWLAEHGPATKDQIADGVKMSPTAGWSRKGFKDMLGSNLAHTEGNRLIAHPLLVG